MTTVIGSGVRLGAYEVLTWLGAGGMGDVWKGRDTRLDRLVAIKQVRDPGARFALEGRAIAALNHPHICQIFDVGIDYLVLEFVDGRPLEGPLPADEAVRLGIQIASALEEAHGRGILHRDLKPANILVTRRTGDSQGAQSVKLLDFGVAKTLTDDAEATQTEDGALIGTPAYMSPEQVEGRSLDARSDIFSFGSVFYEMLTGTRAFPSRGKLEALAAVLRDEPAPLNAPPAVERIVMRCLRKEPSERFQTAAAVKAALEQIGTSTAAASAPATLPPSIAVLPFANTSGDKENEYFSDGLAEEIINALGQIPGLKVTARTSAFAFRGKEQDITQIAEALRVRTVLEGSVRRSGSRVRVTAQLINATDGYHLWSDRFDREMADAFALQDEIAQAIVRTLRSQLTAEIRPARYTPSPAAYQAFLKARFHLSQFHPRARTRGKELIDQAIALDSGFAMPLQERSSYFLHQALIGIEPAHEMMPLARTSALEALACEPSLSEGHALLGVVAGTYEYDWAEQERRFRLALARDPVSPDVWAFSGVFRLFVTGRSVDGVEDLRRALEADPLNLVFRVQLAMCLDASGQVAEAEAELRQVLELNEDFFPANEWLAVFCAFRGRLEEAAGYAERTMAVLGQQARFVGLLAGILHRTGAVDRARGLLTTLGGGDGYGAPTELMIFNLLQAKLDEAAAWAEKAIEQRDPYLPVVLASLVGTALRSTSHWPRLAKLMNLPH